MSFLALLVFTTNCRKETDYTNYLGNSNSTFAEKEMIVLGKQLENPYSIENMQEAYNNLKGNGQTESGGNLTPTHLYIRYLPADEDELQILLGDEDLELFDYPLDYEMEEGGISYHDPNLPDSAITWQYTAVEIGYSFANVEYEIIDSLVIPEFYDEESFTPVFLNQLEEEAFKITGNLKEGMFTSRSGKWTPSGTIRIHDDIIAISNPSNSLIPLKGVKVRARSWFKIKTVYTELDGSFQTDQFRWDVYYSIKWETTEYLIRNGELLQAYYNGPKQTGDWNLNITNGGHKSLRFGTIHRAAHRYYYEDIGGLKRPGTVIKLMYKYKHSLNSYPGIYVFNAKLWKGETGAAGVATTDVLFSTTIHETGHASHKKLIGGITMLNTDPIIRESWANAIEWYITKIEYNHLGITDYDVPYIINRDHQQFWGGAVGNEYTPIFKDLVDNYNQSIENTGFTPSCTKGNWDGIGCLVETAPSEETAHIKTNGNTASYFYYTPVGCCFCPLPNSGLISGVCQVYNGIPRELVPFISGNKMYYKQLGNPEYPYDEVTGYTMADIETNILPKVKTFRELMTEAGRNQPVSTPPNAFNILSTYYLNKLNL
mgnify:CR=1 FL=1|tara:strand:+ start:286 stop:2085 length:1800 start_codon:yes stop_codon:yes gene_type:complete